eukprot:TRINITY_DN104_c0_g1_i1.p1 TRINITY_DN104_c0_g1~~TRINITY_DN104_c0_g1_i1.p1  ORF type:complete len:194 (+),score=20.83 TRINITY_DN104_c0_g1_i1:77-658(+)
MCIRDRTNTLTKVSGFYASEIANPLPLTPTHIPQHKLEIPTEIPVQNKAQPLYNPYIQQSSSVVPAMYYYKESILVIFPDMIIDIITPQIATASQKITLIKFFDLILGDLTAEPNNEAPVINIPHPAPTIDVNNANPIPKQDQAQGVIQQNKSCQSQPAIAPQFISQIMGLRYNIKQYIYKVQKILITPCTLR